LTHSNGCSCCGGFELPSLFATSDSQEPSYTQTAGTTNDTSFALLDHLVPEILFCRSSTFGATGVTIHVFSGGGGGHFEFCPLAQLAVSFERYIGANFSFKWFRLANQSR